jgi:hypothetical protein
MAPQSRLAEAIGKPLSAADVAKLCGLPAGGADTIRPARRQEFREKMRDEVRRRLG